MEIVIYFHLSTPFSSKSTALHVKTSSRTASWEEWMRAWMSSSPRKSLSWIPSNDSASLAHHGTFFSALTSVYIFPSRSPVLFLWRPRRRSLKSSESQDGEKKKSKGGFLNLIKRSSKSDKAEKSHAQAAPAPSSSSTSISEEPSSPKVAVKSPAPEPKSR